MVQQEDKPMYFMHPSMLCRESSFKSLACPWHGEDWIFRSLDAYLSTPLSSGKASGLLTNQTLVTIFICGAYVLQTNVTFLTEHFLAKLKGFWLPEVTWVDVLPGLRTMYKP